MFFSNFSLFTPQPLRSSGRVAQSASFHVFRVLKKWVKRLRKGELSVTEQRELLLCADTMKDEGSKSSRLQLLFVCGNNERVIYLEPDLLPGLLSAYCLEMQADLLTLHQLRC